MKLQLDIDRHEARMGEHVAPLTPQETIVLKMLIMRVGVLVRRQQFIDALYGNDPNGGALSAPRVLIVLICTLRKKLVGIGADAVIALVWSVGYRLDEVLV